MDAPGYIVLVSLISVLIVATFLALCGYVVLYRRRFCRGCASTHDDYERSVASSSVRSLHIDSHIGHPAAMVLPSKDVPFHRQFWNNQSKLQQPVTFAPQNPFAGGACSGTAIPFVAPNQVQSSRHGQYEAASRQSQVDKKSNVAEEDSAVARFRKRYGPKLLSGVNDACTEEQAMVPCLRVASKGTKEDDAMTKKVRAQAAANDEKEQNGHDDEQQGMEDTAIQFYTPPVSPLNDDISWSTPPRVAG